MRALIAVGLLLVVVWGCSAKTTDGGEAMDRRGDLRLVSRDNDLYVERANGSQSRRVTNTPGIIEIGAKFSADGQSIVYSTTTSRYDKAVTAMVKDALITGDHFYIQPVKEDDAARTETSSEEYFRHALRR